MQIVSIVIAFYTNAKRTDILNPSIDELDNGLRMFSVIRISLDVLLEVVNPGFEGLQMSIRVDATVMHMTEDALLRVNPWSSNPYSDLPA